MLCLLHSPSLDGAPSTPLAKRAKMGMASSGGPSTPLLNNKNNLTPIARPTSNGMRPSASFTPSAAAASTPHALSKTTAALPSHLSHSLGPPSSPTTNGLDTPSASSSFVRFEDRQHALEVVETLNGHLSSIIGTATESNTSRIALVSNANPKDYVYRYMFEKTTERAAGKKGSCDLGYALHVPNSR
jgi:hypothetical protein